MKAIATVLLFCSLIFPVAVFAQDDSFPEGAPVDDSQSTVVDPAADPLSTANSVTTPSNANPAPSSTYVFPSNKEIARFGFRGVSKIRALYGSAFSASWKTWVMNSPEEWGKTGGWARRYGSSVVDRGINQSTLVLLSIATKRDPLYYKCPCTGVRARTIHAVTMTFMSRNRQGNSSFSLPDVISPFVGPIITRTTIYPSRYNIGDGIRSGGMQLLSNAGWNVIREFFLKAPAW